MERMRFTNERLELAGGEGVSVLVGREGHDPKTVMMSYESFLELAATLYTAVETLKAAGITPDDLSLEQAESLVGEDAPDATVLAFPARGGLRQAGRAG